MKQVPGSGVVPGYVHGPGTGHDRPGLVNGYAPGKSKNDHGHNEPTSRDPFWPISAHKNKPGSGNVRVPGIVKNYYKFGLGKTDKPVLGHASGTGHAYRPGAAHEEEKGATFGPGTDKINYGPGSGQTHEPVSEQKYESVSEQNSPATTAQIDGTE
uniref:Protein FRIGIDA n=1 Tax=Lygus hesperus TaxID=30085 RepID=A0A0A9WMK1_LYGHE